MRNLLAVKKAMGVVEKFRKDEDGAALIEYTVLLGILLVAVIAVIIFVGGWVSSKWSALSSAISGK
jgi:pilus assembly protein Flp/PilA